MLLYCLPLLFNVLHRGGSSCFGCYSVYHYCAWFDRGAVHVNAGVLSIITVQSLIEDWFMLWLLYCLPLLFKDRQRSGSCCDSYIVYRYSFRSDRGVVHFVVVILSTITF